jgi:tetratricopeptide (TPR) repeat protein
MSIRFRRSMKIAPGLRLNFSKSALGLSFGIPGARVSVNTRGDVYTSAGIPGSGLYAVERRSLRKKRGRSKTQPEPGELIEAVPSPGLFAPRRKVALYHALKIGTIEEISKVGEKYPEIKHICDAFILPRELLATTLDVGTLVKRASDIWSKRNELERDALFTENAKGMEFELKIAPGVSIPMQYGITALGLLYVELLQLHGNYEEALKVAESLEANQATAISVCENEIQLGKWQEVIETTEDIENEDEATALLLIFRAIALREQGLFEAAIETLRLARAPKSRHEDVRNKALFERAITYEKQGKKANAKKDLEKILATDSDFPGVMEKLEQL